MEISAADILHDHESVPEMEHERVNLHKQRKRKSDLLVVFGVDIVDFDNVLVI